MFYKLDKQGQIEAVSSIKRDNSWLETNKNIVRGCDGRLYFEEEAPTKSLEELKLEKKEELKQKREEYKKTIFIRDGFCLLDFEPFDCYNYHNLIRLKCGWEQADLDLFDTHNNYIAETYDSFKTLINTCESKEDLDKIIIKYGE